MSPGQTGRTPGGVPPKFFMFIGFFFFPHSTGKQNPRDPAPSVHETPILKGFRDYKTLKQMRLGGCPTVTILRVVYLQCVVNLLHFVLNYNGGSGLQALEPSGYRGIVRRSDSIWELLLLGEARKHAGAVDRRSLASIAERANALSCGT